VDKFRFEVDLLKFCLKLIFEQIKRLVSVSAAVQTTEYIFVSIEAEGNIFHLACLVDILFPTRISRLSGILL